MINFRLYFLKFITSRISYRSIVELSYTTSNAQKLYTNRKWTKCEKRTPFIYHLTYWSVWKRNGLQIHMMICKTIYFSRPSMNHFAFEYKWTNRKLRLLSFDPTEFPKFYNNLSSKYLKIGWYRSNGRVHLSLHISTLSSFNININLNVLFFMARRM